jgi:large subunit ribosomal protein L5
MGSRLGEVYKKDIVAALMKEFSLANVMEAPKLEKIVINMGLGDAIENVKLVDAAKTELGAITGQQPVVARAKRSIASFKLRAGMPIGVMVTLRQDRMYEFVDRLVHIALPRVRDFRGISAKLDGKGNYTLGIREQIIFPEINYDKVEKVKGMNVTFVTTAPNDEQGRALLTHLGLPFRKG